MAKSFAVRGRRQHSDGDQMRRQSWLRRVLNIGHTTNMFAVCFSSHKAKKA